MILHESVMMLKVGHYNEPDRNNLGLETFGSCWNMIAFNVQNLIYQDDPIIIRYGQLILCVEQMQKQAV